MKAPYWYDITQLTLSIQCVAFMHVTFYHIHGENKSFSTQAVGHTYAIPAKMLGPPIPNVISNLPCPTPTVKKHCLPGPPSPRSMLTVRTDNWNQHWKGAGRGPNETWPGLFVLFSTHVWLKYKNSVQKTLCKICSTLERSSAVRHFVCQKRAQKDGTHACVVFKSAITLPVFKNKLKQLLLNAHSF